LRAWAVRRLVHFGALLAAKRRAGGRLKALADVERLDGGEK
jgi:hypothetical protein